MRSIGQAGDTLVEVVMAFALLAVVMASAFSIANLAQRTAIAARERTIAIQAGQQQAERLYAYRDQLAQSPAYKDKKPIPYSGLSSEMMSSANFPNTDYIINIVAGSLVPAGGVGTCNLPNCSVKIHTTVSEKPVAVAGHDKNYVSGKVTVTWSSLVNTGTNISEFDVALSDPRTGAPRDCSVKGLQCVGN